MFWNRFSLIIVGFFVVFPSAAQATSPELFCAKRVIELYRPRIDLAESYDKFKHCAFSCIIAVHCGSAQSWTVGVLKELQDIVGPGNADWKDYRANQTGIQLAKKHQPRGLQGCKRLCEVPYPSNTPNAPWTQTLFDL